jgi:hypothetical protein
MQPALLMQNLGVLDRVVRVVLGLGLLAIAVYGPRTPVGYLGLIPLATALLGRSPLYALLGINSLALWRAPWGSRPMC